MNIFSVMVKVDGRWTPVDYFMYREAAVNRLESMSVPKEHGMVVRLPVSEDRVVASKKTTRVKRKKKAEKPDQDIAKYQG